MTSKPQLLTDPFLQLPMVNSVRVVWFTEFAGEQHLVTHGHHLEKTTIAQTTKLTRVREDQDSRVKEQRKKGQVYQKPVQRDIWRQEAEITDLTPNLRIPYYVTSITEDGVKINSEVFTLTPIPQPGKPLKILLTSDHQLKPMTAANLQKVVETVGVVDAVWFAGDLVNVPDRASEWFDDLRGNAFFPGLQGRAQYTMEYNGEKLTYTGGKIIQNAPLFPCVGNHEIMGRYTGNISLNQEFNDTIPREIAQECYNEVCGKEYLKDYSFNTITYEEIFSLPESKTGGKTYYALSFGDVRLIVLYVTNAWRNPKLESPIKGRYKESNQQLSSPENWGYGQIIYEPIVPGSDQYIWLEEELNSPEFEQAKYKVVMFHHPAHTLGDNIVPPYTNPLQIIEKDELGNIQSVTYQYPKNTDYIIRDLIPLLEQAKVQLVFYGHSHLWNRFLNQGGINFLETSNVGNSYGAAWGKRERDIPQQYQEDFPQDYIASGNPNGLPPITPTISPLLGEDGQPLPYIASNQFTVFTIFDTETGTVSSYRFDTTNPNSPVIKFDEFSL
ncbi:metallophosphoesterase [Cylindrospermopsis raciborskii Cr2010]|uniref:metallophosphoesterase family protein n=1 Tax=Cylindrospermopsis raciborskii TaxID=77022 RepID=UPI000E1EBEAC|nr:metallophosphoesterase [Cylindrospermopsis raciborskii]UJL35188.1 metallophosphoesterase [Cylindrospermopsis raciborskii Cr2010]